MALGSGKKLKKLKSDAEVSNISVAILINIQHLEFCFFDFSTLFTDTPTIHPIVMWFVLNYINEYIAGRLRIDSHEFFLIRLLDLPPDFINIIHFDCFPL